MSYDLDGKYVFFPSENSSPDNGELAQNVLSRGLFIFGHHSTYEQHLIHS